MRPWIPSQRSRRFFGLSLLRLLLLLVLSAAAAASACRRFKSFCAVDLPISLRRPVDCDVLDDVGYRSRLLGA